MLTVGFVSTVLTACASLQPGNGDVYQQTNTTVLGASSQGMSFDAIVKNMALIPPGESVSRMQAKTTEAVNHIKRMELPEAGKAINDGSAT